ATPASAAPWAAAASQGPVPARAVTQAASQRRPGMCARSARPGRWRLKRGQQSASPALPGASSRTAPPAPSAAPAASLRSRRPTPRRTASRAGPAASPPTLAPTPRSSARPARRAAPPRPGSPASCAPRGRFRARRAPGAVRSAPWAASRMAGAAQDASPALRVPMGALEKMPRGKRLQSTRQFSATPFPLFVRWVPQWA
ncbi:unnamed protein product, partial [Effrenium voratum]